MSIKVKIHRPFDTLGLGITIYDERDRKIWVAKPVELVFEPLEVGQYCKPTMHIDYYMEKEFLKAMAEELNEQGVKTDNDHKIIGTLEATKYHLEDMRMLMKLRKL